MQLNENQLSQLVFGAYESVYEQDGVQFYRMPDKQARYFEKHNSDFYDKARSTAGITLDFYTDSEFFSFGYHDIQKGATRPWCYFDVYLNGARIASVGEDLLTKNEYAYSTALPKGENRITLFFPNLFRAKLTQVTLSDGATVRPAQKKRRILFLGDSITHGYDAKYPSQSYANRVSFQTDSEAVNLAIGGACFAEDCLDETLNYRPDIIVVAYGTNDWRKKAETPRFADCEAFFDKLCRIYPDKPIFYILPIRRYRDCETEELQKSFLLTRKKFEEIATAHGRVKIIDLWEDIPDDTALYSDGLHPNDEGFAYYADGVIKHLNFEDK